MLAESMSVYLERHGYSTVMTHAGEDGVRMAGEASPEGAVTDVRRPGIDGFEILERLRELSPVTAGSWRRHTPRSRLPWRP